MKVMSKLPAIILLITIAFELSAQLTVGAKAPDLSFTEVINKEDGTIQSISDFEDEILVLDFWAVWCTPCVASIPDLNELHDQYKDQGVNFLSITDDPADKLANFLNMTEFKFWIARDQDKQTFKSYDIFGRPAYFIVNRMGVIAYAGSYLTAEILDEVLATDFVKLPAEQVQQFDENSVITSGPFSPGDDPVYNAVRTMLGQSDREIFEYDRIHQFVIRPSLEDGTLGYGQKTGRGYIGLSHIGSKLEEILTFLKDLPSVHRIANHSSKTGHYDLIYWKPAPGLEEAKQEVIDAFITGLQISIDTLQEERTIKMLVDNGQQLPTIAELPPGTGRNYYSLQEIAALLENETGVFYELEPTVAALFVSTKELSESGWLGDLGEAKLLSFLKKNGIGVVEKTQTVTVYQINNASDD